MNRPQLAENSAIVNALAELKQLTAMFSGIVDPSMEPSPIPSDPLGTPANKEEPKKEPEEKVEVKEPEKKEPDVHDDGSSTVGVDMGN